MIRLLLKGTPDDALKAATERNIPLSNLRLSGSGYETIAETEDHYQVAVIQWYCEPTACKPQQGYDPGTPLYYSFMD